MLSTAQVDYSLCEDWKSWTAILQLHLLFEHLQRNGKIGKSLVNPVESLTNSWLYDDGAVNEQLRNIFMPVVPKLERRLGTDETLKKAASKSHTGARIEPVIPPTKCYTNNDVSPFNEGKRTSTDLCHVPVTEDRRMSAEMEGMSRLYNLGEVEVSQCLDTFFLQPDEYLVKTAPGRTVAHSPPTDSFTNNVMVAEPEAVSQVRPFAEKKNLETIFDLLTLFVAWAH